MVWELALLTLTTLQGQRRGTLPLLVPAAKGRRAEATGKVTVIALMTKKTF